jgi:uncharacterized protein (TIGR01777 family)
MNQEQISYNIAISGSTGLVGSAMIDRYKKLGHDIVRMIRPKAKLKGEDPFIIWNIQNKKIDLESLEGLDAVVHLAGANVAGKRWSQSYKDLIYSSRVQGTEFLSRSLAQLKKPPKVFICASAIGYYGNQPAQVELTEDSPAGNDFLARVCVDWEAATKPAAEAGIRVVNMRLGTVMSPQGGALAKMLPPFKFGLGGKIGDGQQIMSWVSVDEIPEAILFFIQNEQISGPVNVVGPHPVTNTQFTEIFGRVLGRPTVFPMPKKIVEIIFGEMGRALLLGGQKVLPKKLQDGGYHFLYHSLESALNDLLLVE